MFCVGFLTFVPIHFLSRESAFLIMLNSGAHIFKKLWIIPICIIILVPYFPETCLHNAITIFIEIIFLEAIRTLEPTWMTLDCRPLGVSPLVAAPPPAIGLVVGRDAESPVYKIINMFDICFFKVLRAHSCRSRR